MQKALAGASDPRGRGLGCFTLAFGLMATTGAQPAAAQTDAPVSRSTEYRGEIPAVSTSLANVNGHECDTVSTS